MPIGLALGLPFPRPSGGTPFVGPLDDYTSNLAVVLNLRRRLLSSYTGPLFKVRADRTGQPEQDIGFLANGDLDTASLQSFVGSSSAFVTTVYRQDGSSDHAVQSTASRQPRIALAGVIEDGALFYLGSGSSFLDIPSAASTVYSDGTNIQVLIDANNKTDTNGRLIDAATGSLGFWSPFTGLLYWDAPLTGGRISVATPGGYANNYTITSLERAGSTSSIRVAGSVVATAGVSGSITGTSVFRIGNLLGAGGGPWSGCLRSLIVWKDCTSPATRAGALTL
jgi:hypothetical protein